ncbi:LuxR C-terminal-related transcriptional regulator [uncultured Microbacterium sp.]|uniref:LuxR C-terminal-related transcriptional regulator n=1 Tax=uncultured Microbacterium sp. TaxID=191216 RepID=UPI0025E0EE68|nr:LuxR C-terminal-related transcriptional regulator [uncultured Microbacterium sp.]
MSRPSDGRGEHPHGHHPERRALDVLRADARGETVAEIASALLLPARTVRNHVSSVLGKVGFASRQQATTHAREWGWI